MMRTGRAFSGSISRLGFLSPLLALANAAFAADCASLTLDALPNVAIDRSEPVEAGAFRRSGPQSDRLDPLLASLPAFCRVMTTATPVPDSQIGIEIWLPLKNWNGKLLAVGNGGWAGSISYAALAAALQRGYATASTDTGHTGNNSEFAMGHPEKVIDFGHRAVHQMTVTAKAIIEAHYDAPPSYSYFEGCSTGGRQALAEAQRYPQDFDGIIAGAPASYVTHLQGSQIWSANVAYREPGAALIEEQLPLINRAVIAACDGLDGAADGVVENPMQCPFDASSLVCRPGESAECLTPSQAETVNLKYRGPADERGNVLYPGAARGSELEWANWLGPEPLSLADDVYAVLVFGDRDWDHREFEFTDHVPLAVERIGDAMDSIDTNLEPFFSLGGKLLMYHGWNDPLVPPEYTVEYNRGVLQAVGPTFEDSIRLFMVPGMNHCRGGIGTDTFDRISALDAWVTSGVAPDSISAAKIRNGEAVRTRPLCRYPEQAIYDGLGSLDDESNFYCAVR